MTSAEVRPAINQPRFQPQDNNQVPPATKLAMSRALGAAFLNHQVEQLEKTVTNDRSGNWRDRRQQDHNSQPTRGIIQKRTPAGKPLSPGRKRAEDKDADVIVVDASVLVHALNQVKTWCRSDRKELIVVPLEGAFSPLYIYPTWCRSSNTNTLNSA